MHDDLYEPIVRLFSLLAHPARLRILDLLRRGEAYVCHLQAVLRVSQPYVSQQLRVLREAGLISQHREGFYIYYRLADPRVEHLLAEVLGPVEEIPPLPECPCPRCREASRWGVNRDDRAARGLENPCSMCLPMEPTTDHRRMQ